MRRVDVQHEFTKPPERVFAYLAEHEHLGPVLGAKITRLRDGTDGRRNGVGSARELKIGPLPSFEETNTEVVDDRLIRYRITRGSPLNHHRGTMTFDPSPSGGTRFSWTIELGSAIPGLAALVELALTRSITKAMGTVEAKA